MTNALINIAFSLASIFLLWKILKTLKIISRDTVAKEELADSIEKFAALAAGRKEKIVAFKAKEKDDV